MELKQESRIKIMFLAALIIAALLTVHANAKMVVKVNATERLAVDYNVPTYGAWYFDQELVLNNTRNMIIPPCDSLNDTFCTDSSIIWNNTTTTVPVCDNATWCFDPNLAFGNKTPRFHNELVYSPNVSDIGYHNITFRGVPLMGVPYENIHNFEIFVGTLFVANGSIVNATTSSILVEPAGSYNITTFVENVTGVFVPWAGENAQIQFKVSSVFFNLTNISSNTGKKTQFGNGLKYSFPFNTVGKNGTFLVSLNKPYAETVDGQRINVSAQTGEIEVLPKEDVDGNGYIKNSADTSLVRKYALANGGKGTNVSSCPDVYCRRSNFIPDNIVTLNYEMSKKW